MTTQHRFMSGLLSFTAGEADWDALYASEMPRVYNFFRYRVTDEALAEDLTSTTFEKAWRGRDQYRSDLAGFSTWLFSIARNVATDYYRRRRVELPLDEIRNQPDERSSQETLADAAQKRTDLRQLSLLMRRLPERERELLAMKYGAGLTNREIARVTRLSESNVGTILHRTVQSLRSEWQE